MSFGFSIGDFITVIELANKIRKEFLDAPSQFKAISDEVRSLSIILLDVEVVLSDRELRSEQEAELKQIANGCRNTLDQLEHTLDEYDELKSGHGIVSKRMKRVWKRLKWEPEDIKQLRSRISTNISLLNAFTSQITRDNVVTLVRIQEDQGRQAILDWITPIDYALQQSDFINRRQPGTGQWLLSSVEFKAWVETDKQTLFCPGIPGAGKTILTSIVVEELFTRFKNDGNISIAYLYCNYQRQYEQNINDLFASLLKQLVQEQPSIPDSIKTLYDQHKDKRTRPSLNEILQLLQTIAAVYSRVFIIIDAVDECQISDGCRQKFLSGLFSLQAKCKANLFTTSRPIPSIEREFEGHLILEINASEEDVRRYLEGHMFQLPRFVARSLELQEEIKTEIIKAVDGMFLLAQLHLESLTGKRSPKAIRTALKNLVTGSGAYDYAYKDAMERINGQIKDQEELAKQVLSWITCAKKQLTATELQHALGIEVGESELDQENFSEIEDIVSVCAGLVTIDEESGIIRLIHYTTQEYFERTQCQWFPDAQFDIMTICVSYLSLDQFSSGICQNDEEFEQRLQSNKLYEYAAHNWGHHAREASTIYQGVMDFFQRQAQVDASSQALLTNYALRYKGYSQSFPKKMTGLHLAAYFGIKGIFQLLLDKGADIMVVNSYRWTPLHYASYEGHLEIAQLLLDKGADAKAADSGGWTPLYYASKQRHLEIAQLLLDNGADAEAVDPYGWTPLCYASDEGQLEIAQLLLDNGADITAVDSDGRTPLHYASVQGQLEIAQLLLDKGADITAVDSDGRTPLCYASDEGQLEIAQLLLDKGADITAVDFDGWTPLYYASSGGHLEIVQLLLDNGADAEVANSDGWISLLLACEQGRLGIVQLLLDNGADIEAVGSIGQTPLHYASDKGHLKIAQLLLDKGADIEAVDFIGQTPLHLASNKGHLEIFQLLINKGADVKAVDFDGWTPLHYASSGGPLEIVQLLLDKGADIKAVDFDGQTPLCYASEYRYLEAVQLLLDKGAERIK